MQGQVEREERVPVARLVGLMMQADRHPDPDIGQSPMLSFDPAANGAGHDRQQRVVDGRPTSAVGGAVQLRDPHSREPDLPSGADVPVEGRPSPSENSLAKKPPSCHRRRASSWLMSATTGVDRAGAGAAGPATSSHSRGFAHRSAVVPSASGLVTG
jgi:hypothetical protein